MAMREASGGERSPPSKPPPSDPEIGTGTDSSERVPEPIPQPPKLRRSSTWSAHELRDQRAPAYVHPAPPKGGAAEEKFVQQVQQRRADADATAWRGLLAGVAGDAGGVVAAELWVAGGESGDSLLRRRARWAAEDPPLSPTAEIRRRDLPEPRAARARLAEPPPPCAPGVGVAGVVFQSAPQDRSHWWRLDHLADDPETPYDVRTKDAALTYRFVGGVSLPPGRGGQVAGVQGVLLLFTELPDDDDENAPPPPCAREGHLRELSDRYLADAAQAASWTVAMHASRDAYARRRRFSAARAWAVLRTAVRFGFGSRRALTQALENVAPPPSPPHPVLQWLVTYFRKWGGAGGKQSPAATWQQSMLTFLGVFLTLLIVSSLSKFAKEESEGEWWLLIGSLGALYTLLFAAPNSPLGQPRNVVGGHLVAGVVAMLFWYITDSPQHDSAAGYAGTREYGRVLPRWLAAALCPATAIALMARLGVVHPPAGAVSLIFIAGGGKVTNLGWVFLAMPIGAAIAISLIMAAAFNNACTKRQYPVVPFWSIIPGVSWK